MAQKRAQWARTPSQSLLNRMHSLNRQIGKTKHLFLGPDSRVCAFALVPNPQFQLHRSLQRFDQPRTNPSATVPVHWAKWDPLEENVNAEPYKQNRARRLLGLTFRGLFPRPEPSKHNLMLVWLPRRIHLIQISFLQPTDRVNKAWAFWIRLFEIIKKCRRLLISDDEQPERSGEDQLHRLLG